MSESVVAEKGRSRGIHGDVREEAFTGRVLRVEIGGAGATCAGWQERGPRLEAFTQGLLQGTFKLDEDLANLVGRLPRWAVSQSLKLCTSLRPPLRTGETKWSSESLHNQKPREQWRATRGPRLHKGTPPWRWRAAERRRP